MTVLNAKRIGELLKHQSPLCVSLFMPTHRTGREQLQDPIRLKNLMRDAGGALRREADSSDVVDEVLKPAMNLRDDETFWRHRSDGLGCFCAPEFFRAYRVPLALEEQWFVNDRFYIRPLLPLLRFNARLYILALTQKDASLFEASKYSIREIELPEIAPVQREDGETSLQYHSHQAPAHGRGQTEAAIYHGHGEPADREKKDTVKFFQRVDRAVARVLRGQRDPLVLACVGYLAPLYQEANRYGHLMKGKVPGSPDRWTKDELREHAWQLVEPDLRREEQEAWERFEQSQGNNGASDDLQAIVLAADQGRVETLFLARGEERWGHVDPERQAVQIVEDDQQGEELLDYAAAMTITNGGEVILFDSLPDSDAPAAATFRY